MPPKNQRVKKSHEHKLDELKENVEQWQEYFEENITRYHEYINFVFNTSLTEEERQTLQNLGKPTIEFNILEAYISRLRGEFAKQQPSLTVRAADGVPLSMIDERFTKTIEVIEAHLRAIFFDAANDKLEYNIYTDLLAGGFSAVEIFTDYVSAKSFEQNIYVDRVFDPTLTGFDPLARESHKGDGRYCFKLYPKTKSEFEDLYGKEMTEGMKFTKSLEGFSWSYNNEQEDIVLICDYFEKEKRNTKIVKLSNGHTVTKKEYEQFLIEWEESGAIEKPPEIVKERTTQIEHIVRYRFVENRLIDVRVTNFQHLPIIFIDGNSVNITENESTHQMTRPYVYHAKGIQRLKNFAGQSLGNEIENTVQHKWMVALESIPEDYQEAYQDVQKADTLVYHHFYDPNAPEITLPPPREVQRTAIPPEITNTFKMSDEMTQAILGSYDSSLGINNNQLSGAAIAKGAMQSNNASMPYIVGYIKGLNRVAQVIVDLIPKYYRTPRSLPVLELSGKRSYIVINTPESLYMNYEPDSLQVKVETGVNFAMQKEIALQTIVNLMQSSQLFAQFINSHGLKFLLDNIEIRGIEELKNRAEDFEKELQQQQQQSQQQQQQQQQYSQAMQGMELAQAQKKVQSPTDEQIDMYKQEREAQRDAAKIAIDEQNAETKFIETISKVRDEQVDNELEQARIAAENARTQVEMLEALSRLKSNNSNNK